MFVLFNESGGVMAVIDNPVDQADSLKPVFADRNASKVMSMSASDKVEMLAAVYPPIPVPTEEEPNPEPAFLPGSFQVVNDEFVAKDNAGEVIAKYPAVQVWPDA